MADKVKAAEVVAEAIMPAVEKTIKATPALADAALDKVDVVVEVVEKISGRRKIAIAAAAALIVAGTAGLVYAIAKRRGTAVLEVHEHIETPTA